MNLKRCSSRGDRGKAAAIRLELSTGGRRKMSVICHHTMSLDGFIAGPDDSMGSAFAFGNTPSLADGTMNRVGAILPGRRWYDLAIRTAAGNERFPAAMWCGFSQRPDTAERVSACMAAL